MLKHEMTYEDLNGNQVTEIFYFNLSKVEIIELEVDVDGGFAQMLQNIVETKDNKKLVRQFQNIILMAYGQKSEDGKRFIKSEKLREEFSQSVAYVELFMQLTGNEGVAVNFLKGILPKDLVVELEKVQPEVLPVPNT